MRFEAARPADLAAVETLLADAGLPLDGAADAFAHGVVVRDGVRIVGAAALEAYDHAGLLRSVVVAPDHRGEGLGRDLVAHAEDLARSVGIAEVYLITETAERWFPRLGYIEMPRDHVPPSIAESVEFTTACSTSAIVMRRDLGS